MIWVNIILVDENFIFIWTHSLLRYQRHIYMTITFTIRSIKIFLQKTCSSWFVYKQKICYVSQHDFLYT